MDLPDSITEIGPGAFYGCKSLKDINLHNSITRIEYGAFYNCSSLAQLNLPDSITEIGYYAFYDCTSLVHVYIPNQLQTINSRAFKGCSSLSIIAVPDHVAIPSNCFEDCDLINKVKDLLNLSSTNTTTADDDYYFLHHQHRFANRPLHRVCYDPNLTLETLTTTIEAVVGDNLIDAIDDFNMNALHFLCSSPNVSSQMISTFVKACPSLLTMRSIDNMTPLMMLMMCKGIVSYDDEEEEVKERVSLRSCFQCKIAWNDIECMLVMDAEMRNELRVQDEETGLYPLMELALDTSPYNLDNLYGLLHLHPFLLDDN